MSRAPYASRTQVPTERSVEEIVRNLREHARRWRVMALYVKARLVAVREGVVEYGAAFLAEIVGDGGATLYESIRPQLDAGRVPGQLELPGRGS